MYIGLGVGVNACNCAGACLRIVVCSSVGPDVGVDALEFFFGYVWD